MEVSECSSCLRNPFSCHAPFGSLRPARRWRRRKYQMRAAMRRAPIEPAIDPPTIAPKFLPAGLLSFDFLVLEDVFVESTTPRVWSIYGAVGGVWDLPARTRTFIGEPAFNNYIVPFAWVLTILLIPIVDSLWSGVSCCRWVVMIFPFHVAQVENANPLWPRVPPTSSINTGDSVGRASNNGHLSVSVTQDTASMQTSSLRRLVCRFLPMESRQGKHIDGVEFNVSIGPNITASVDKDLSLDQQFDSKRFVRLLITSKVPPSPCTPTEQKLTRACG